VIDWFVLLTPLLMLGVLALVRFVGCNQIFGLDETVAIVDPPTHVIPKAGDQRVDLTWEYAKNADRFEIWFHADTPDHFALFANSNIAVTTNMGTQYGSASMSNLTNGTQYFFKVRAYIKDSFGETDPVGVAPGITSFVTTIISLGVDRSSLNGRCGMAVRMTVDTKATQLGRMMSGNAQAHELSIVDASQPTVVLGTVSWTPDPDPLKEGMFLYYPLLQPVLLQALHTYYILSHEQSGEHFHDINGMMVSTSAVGMVTSGVSEDNDLMVPLTTYGTANQLYGPVDFRY
jgi:hypothetical protein